MIEFTSKITQIPHSATTVYEVLSDLNNLAILKDRIPQDLIQDFSFNHDSCTFNIKQMGNMRFYIEERDPGKTIKFTTDRSPVNVYIWIQLREMNPQDTRMKLTVTVELSPMLKPMLGGPLQKGLNQIADILAAIPYETLGKEHQD
jgi:hypothetical protein